MYGIMINKDTFAKEVGKRISAHRKQQGLSQGELGKFVNCSQQMIGDYEVGRRRIPACNLASIADALGLSTAVLIDGAEQSRNKRGPASKVNHLANKILTLPRTRQRFIVEMLEDALARAQ